MNCRTGNGLENLAAKVGSRDDDHCGSNPKQHRSKVAQNKAHDVEAINTFTYDWPVAGKDNTQ